MGVGPARVRKGRDGVAEEWGEERWKKEKRGEGKEQWRCQDLRTGRACSRA